MVDEFEDDDDGMGYGAPKDVRPTPKEDPAVAARAVLQARKEAYFRLFGGAAMPGDKQIVMEDLKKFCRGGETPWSENERVHCLLTGRFETYRRILDFTSLSVDELVDKYVRGAS